MSTNVYLAGKFKGVNEFDDMSTHNWRDDILAYSSTKAIDDEDDDLDRSSNKPEWKVRKNGIANGINCTGAFFMGEHSCPYLNNHGWDEYSRNIFEANNKVFELCKRAIDKSDIFFAWINSSDCHGTLVEIGYAYQKVKYLIVTYATKQLAKDVWFPSCFADITAISSNPRNAFLKTIGRTDVYSEYIYVAWVKGTTNYKIGRSSNHTRTIHDLNSFATHPYEIEPLIVAPVYDSCKEESSLHQRFWEYHTHGNWFNLHPLAVNSLFSYYNETLMVVPHKN